MSLMEASTSTKLISCGACDELISSPFSLLSPVFQTVLWGFLLGIYNHNTSTREAATSVITTSTFQLLKRRLDVRQLGLFLPSCKNVKRFLCTLHRIIGPFSAPVVSCLGYKVLQCGIIVQYRLCSTQREASFALGGGFML